MPYKQIKGLMIDFEELSKWFGEKEILNTKHFTHFSIKERELFAEHSATLRPELKKICDKHKIAEEHIPNLCFVNAILSHNPDTIKKNKRIWRDHNNDMGALEEFLKSAKDKGTSKIIFKSSEMNEPPTTITSHALITEILKLLEPVVKSVGGFPLMKKRDYLRKRILPLVNYLESISPYQIPEQQKTQSDLNFLTGELLELFGHLESWEDVKDSGNTNYKSRIHYLKKTVNPLINSAIRGIK